MEKRFQDKVCIVTGGTSGIGRATAEQLAAEGARVVLVDLNAAEGREVLREIKVAGGQALFVRADLGKDAQLQKVVAQTLAKWQRIDVLINNAAMMTFTPIVQLDPAQWDTVMNVNLRALFRLCQLCLPHMQGGSVVVVSSVHAHQTTPGVVPYAASKGAQEAFVRGLSLEIPIAQARINALAPGAVDTAMLWENPNVKSGKEEVSGHIGKPSELANAICFLASDAASFINGATLVVDGGRLAQL